MRASLCIATSLLGACMIDHHADPTPVASEPSACTQDVSLDGSTGTSTPTTIGPLTLGASGSTICLHLDATHNLVAAHFAASSDVFTSESSGVLAVLQDPDRLTLQDGWDVTIGDAPPETRMNLEWDAPLHEVTEAVLWVRAGNASAVASSIEVALFEPLED